MGGGNLKIQVLRGLAIIAVVMIHTCPLGMMQVLFRPILNGAVAVFIFLSGWLTPYKVNEKSLRFAKRRILRVLIPYIAWTFIYTIASKNMMLLGRNLLTASGTPHLYYILVYMQITCVAPFLWKIWNSKFRNVVWIVSPVFLILYRYVLPVINIRMPEWLRSVCENSFLGWFIFFYLGFVLGNNLVSVNMKKKYLLVLYIVSLILQLFEGMVWLELGSTNPMSQWNLTACASSLLIIALMNQYLFSNCCLGKIEKTIILVGNYSFGIYLSHVLMIRILMKSSVYCSLPFIINSLVVVLISLFFVRIIGEIVGDRFARIIGLI